MNNLSAVIYFVEPEAIEAVLPDWPHEMRLAMCLYKSGQCEIMVFHRNEDQGIIERMRDILKLEEGHFGVVPETRGYPTRTIRFSEQQYFLKLIEEKQDLCELASDYAINYRFAEEEGLDPVYFTNNTYKGQRAISSTAAKDGAPTKPFVTRRIKSGAPLSLNKKPKIEKNATVYPKKKSGFVGNFAEIARMESSGRYVLLTLNPDTAPARPHIYRANGLIHIGEPNQFLLERPLLQDWSAGKSAVIEIPKEQLFYKFAYDYFDTPRIAVVMIVPNDIYVTCGPKIPAEEFEEEPQSRGKHPFPSRPMQGLDRSGNQSWQ